MIGFSVPVLTPVAVRVLATTLNRAVFPWASPESGVSRATPSSPAQPNGLKIYRANFLRSLVRAGDERHVAVPVQLLVNSRDKFVRPWVYDDTPRWVPRLWRRDLPAGHWLPMSNPDLVAGAVDELIGHIEGGEATRALLRAQVGRERKPFGDSLVVVTEAGQRHRAGHCGRVRRRAPKWWSATSTRPG